MLADARTLMITSLIAKIKHYSISQKCLSYWSYYHGTTTWKDPIQRTCPTANKIQARSNRILTFSLSRNTESLVTMLAVRIMSFSGLVVLVMLLQLLGSARATVPLAQSQALLQAAASWTVSPRLNVSYILNK